MSQILLSKIKIRTFGWIQNPGDFKKLKKVVQVFDHTSETYKEIVERKIPRLVEDIEVKDRLLKALYTIPIKLKYLDLVGTSFNPRKSAKCNGIIQATIKGQKKDFTDDWTSDGFIRWAYAFGFIEYDYLTDSFSITQLGYDFSKSIEDSEEEKGILIDAALSYPPAVRILDLLKEGEHLTKYDIGKNLGFTGEAGFTSLPQNIFIESLISCEDSEIKKSMRSDWDGSSDKYARMISGWLSKLGLVKIKKKIFTLNIDGEEKSEHIAQSYVITPDGLKQLRRAHGIGSLKKLKKIVCWEMLSTKDSDKVYLRTRRAYILKIIEKSNHIISLELIKEKLSKIGIDESVETIKQDIQGLINIGLYIDLTSRGCYFKDLINDFVIPVVKIDEINKSNIEKLKEELRPELMHISHDYLQLLELSQNSRANRLFEMKVMDILVNEYGYKGEHLGGSRKPDGVVYTTNLESNYGIIIDTKAYKDGYSLPIGQADEMERYVRENITRNEEINPNKWWEVFPSDVENYKFIFVSSSFKGRYEEQLKRIYKNTNTYGAVINVENLLLGAEYIRRGVLKLDDIESRINNSEISF